MRNLILDVYNKTKVILGVFLVLSVFLCVNVGTAVGVRAAVLPDPGTQKLYKGTGNSKVELSETEDNQLDSLDDELTISFDWNIDQFEGFQANTAYDLPLPLYIKAGTDIVDGLKIPIEPGGGDPYTNPNNHLATIHKSASGEITIEFTEVGIDHHYAHIELGCHLDATKHEADSEGKVVIPIGGGITIQVDTLKPSNTPSLAKSNKNGGRVASDGTVTWKLEYDPGDPNITGITYPNQIIDKLPTGMNFVTGSC